MVGRSRVPVRVPLRRRAADGTWGHEPIVGEMLEDPIVNLMMARDHVVAEDIHRLIAMVRRSRDMSTSESTPH